MMTYLELLQALEHRLGNQHLPLNPGATSLKNIFDGSPVHHDMMRRVVQALYKTNACRQLNDEVSRDSCFDALGPVRRDVLKASTTDVDAYHLIEELCQALDEIFAPDRTPPATDDKRSAEVISLDSARRRRAR